MTYNNRDLILKIFDKLDRIDANVSELKATVASLDVLVETNQNKLLTYESRLKALEDAGKRIKTWALTTIFGAFISAVIGWEVRKALP